MKAPAIIIMIYTLYLPGQQPRITSHEIPALTDALSGLVYIPEQVAALLDCKPELIDVLARGPRYVAYSVFDCEQEINPLAMNAIGEITGMLFDHEDMILRGPVLLVTRS